MSVILTNRMFRGRNTRTDHTMRWLLLSVILTVKVNDGRCATIENATIKPSATVKTCTLANITYSQLTNSSCDTAINYLFIKNSSFDSLPPIFDFFPNLLSVDVSSAGIQHIDTTTFHFATHLVTLDMDESNMPTLASNLFTRMNNLTSFDMANSSIEIVEKYAFNGLSNLKKLDLSGNKIVSLQTGLFHPLSRLDTIRLGNNKIEVIDKDLFMHNSELTWVYLSNNDIISVDPNSFTSCKLKLLDFGWNQLRDLDLTAMGSLKQLTVTGNQLSVLKVPSVAEKVHAQNNSIAVIHSDETSQLLQLYLSFNHFTNFSSLANFKKLEFLDVSNNHLRNFTFSNVKALTQLKELQLCRNKLSEIRAADVFTNLPNLRMLELSTKHWSDGYVEQLESDLKNHSIELGQDRIVIPDDDSSGTTTSTSTTYRPVPVTTRKPVTTQSPNDGSIDQRLNEIRKQLSDLEYRTGANAAADSKKIDIRLAGVEDKLMKLNEGNDAKLEGLRSSFKIYDVLVVIMFISLTAFVLYKLILHSKGMLSGMRYRRAQSTDPIFSEQDL